MQLAEDFIEGGKLFGDWKLVLGWELSKDGRYNVYVNIVKPVCVL